MLCFETLGALAEPAGLVADFLSRFSDLALEMAA
jgi:hypothetical protein